MADGWAIACVLFGSPHLYYASLQYEPVGSITLARISDRGPLLRPMFFASEGSASSVLKVIVKAKPLADLFEWKIVYLEGIDQWPFSVT